MSWKSVFHEKISWKSDFLFIYVTLGLILTKYVIWNSGNLGTWSSGNLKSRELGNLKFRELGNFGTSKLTLGCPLLQRLAESDILKYFELALLISVEPTFIFRHTQTVNISVLCSGVGVGVLASPLLEYRAVCPAVCRTFRFRSRSRKPMGDFLHIAKWLDHHYKTKCAVSARDILWGISTRSNSNGRPDALIDFKMGGIGKTVPNS